MDLLIGVLIALGIVVAFVVVVVLALGTIYSMALRDLEGIDDFDLDGEI